MAYRLPSSKDIRVELESPDGKAILTFRRPKLNEMLDEPKHLDGEADTARRAVLNFKHLLTRLISVEGMEDDAGANVTVARLQSLDLDIEVMLAIINAYVIALGGGAVADSPEKKESAPA